MTLSGPAFPVPPYAEPQENSLLRKMVTVSQRFSSYRMLVCLQFDILCMIIVLLFLKGVEFDKKLPIPAGHQHSGPKAEAQWN